MDKHVIETDNGRSYADKKITGGAKTRYRFKTTPVTFIEAEQPGAQAIDPELVKTIACWEFGVLRGELEGTRHSLLLKIARSYVAWAMRNIGEPWEYADIGRFLGGRTAGSVALLHMAAISRLPWDETFRNACERLRNRLEDREQCHVSAR